MVDHSLCCSCETRHHSSTDRKFKALTSLEQIGYESLYDVFNILVNEKLRIVTLKSQYRLFKTEKEPVNNSLNGVKQNLILF